jgi:hypothetical protein
LYYETGLFIPVINQIKTMSADDWERFVEEWMSSRTDEYFDFERLGGVGDQGRDVVGFVGNPVGNHSYVWDNYQCKHYSNPLSPSMRFNTLLPNRPQVPRIHDDVLGVEINYVNKLPKLNM